MQTTSENQTPAFTGVTDIGSLADLIQMECSVMATRAVRIDWKDRCGRIYFSRGQVVHAEVAALVGETALFVILAWPGGHVVIADGVQPPFETINRHWQSLLIEAAPQPMPIRPRLFSGRRKR